MFERLSLRSDFPPVSTDEWEAAIRRDLQGGDYDALLIWRTGEGIAVKPYYRREDLEKLSDMGRRASHSRNAPHQRPPAAVEIRADSLREAGASIVQELAF